MSTILDVARKELRASFESPVALLFLGAFLVAVLFGFFTFSGFFARNLADVRPLFEWLPVLLILLVAAITMRQWAEERKMGTLEVLLTLPVRTSHLVLGKFLGGLALVALALALTLPLPFTVAMLGDLDWGPVIGGYVAALLLGALYLSIGLCVSARTDNQVVALMVTVVLGGLLYLTGTDRFTGFFSGEVAEVLRAIGTGSRFESIERGVLDLRDLAYYASLTAFFLVLNVQFLELPRIDATQPAGRKRARSRHLLSVLAGLNVLALNLWLAPVAGLRADLTEQGTYSIHRATKETLARLDEPLYIDGYFSQRTHPLLAPLVPRIRDLLAEYQVQGRGRVHVTITDPGTDEELQQTLAEQYGIHSFPFAVSERNAQSVVNSYFHILVRYGDQYQVLSFEDLIEVSGDPVKGLEVGLRNPEYDLTRAIRRATQEFQSLDSLVAKLPEGTTFTLYVTPQTLPDSYQDAVEHVRKVATEVAADSKGRVRFEEVDPLSDPSIRDDLASRLDIRPLAADLFGQRVFYAHLVLEGGGKVERILARGGLSEAEIRKGLEAAVKRMSPGQLKTVGLYTNQPEAPPPNPNIPPQYQPPPPQPDYRGLTSLLQDEYEVEPLDLADGDVPDQVDVLVVGKAGPLSDKAEFALDQYLMRGGRVIAFAGAWDVEAQRGAGLTVKRDDSGLLDLLKAWGVEVDDALVMDPQNAPFPIPVQERQGPFVVNRVEMLPYPFFPDIRRDGYAKDQPALAQLPNVTMPWASPLETEPREGVEEVDLLHTSAGSWLRHEGDIQPDFKKYPDGGFGEEGDTAPRTVAVTLTGTLPSYFADRPNPLWPDGGEAGGDRTGRTLKVSVPEARLVVLGSSEVVSDLMLGVARQIAGEVHQSNLQLVKNLVDWSVEDLDLLEIRSAGSYARTLDPLTDEQRRRWELGNYAVVLLALIAVVAIPRRRRRATHPIPLVPVEET